MRVEHCQHMQEEDLQAIAALGLVVSVQPYQLVDDAPYLEDALGQRMANTSYRFASLMAAGAPVIFGSDWPVAPANPIKGATPSLPSSPLPSSSVTPSCPPLARPLGYARIPALCRHLPTIHLVPYAHALTCTLFSFHAHYLSLSPLTLTLSLSLSSQAHIHT